MKNVRLSLSLFVPSEKKRNLEDGTLYYRFVFSFFHLFDESEKEEQEHISILYIYEYGEEQREKCYAETLLAIITRPTNGLCVGKKKLKYGRT